MIEINITKKLAGSGGNLNLEVTFEINEGDFVTLYGESGAGKTSILKMIAGLFKPDKGIIRVAGQTWYDSERRINLSPQKRGTGLVFQDYALFPHMTVNENLRFALDKKSDPSIIDELIDAIELAELKDRKPDTLSGGQKQRVALARALVQRPKLLMLDEPLAALDPKIRRKLREYLLRIHREFGLTTILVSHDTGEIMALSNKIFLLDRGKIKNQGSPQSLFARQEISGKFSFTGEILAIEKQDIIYVLTVLVQNNVVKVVAEPEEILNLRPGDTILLASKAFNPVIWKPNDGT